MEITPEIQAVIDEHIDELKKHNARLLVDLKRSQKEIDLEEYHRMKQEYQDITDKLAETQRAVKAAHGETEKLKKAYEAESGFTQKLLVDNGLTDALVKNGIAPQFLSAVKAMFAGQTQVVVDGDNRAARIGDKAIADFVSEWSKTDEGKHFVAAPANGGGGSQGGRGQSGLPDLSGLKPTDRINAARAAKA